MKHIFKYLIILAFGGYNYHLYTTNQLGIYINQRFFDFTYLMSVLAIAFSLLGIAYVVFENRSEIKKSLSEIQNNQYLKIMIIGVMIILSIAVNINLLLLALILSFTLLKNVKLKPSLSYIGMFIAIGVMVFTAPKSLSSITAFQRESDFNSVTLQGSRSPIQAFSNTENYDLGEWISSIMYNPDISSYEGKSVSVRGFIFPRDGFGEDIFMASRFVVTCCAVDARPVGLPVKFEWKDKFKIDEWVRATGKFEVQNINGQDVLVIVAENVEKVDVPSNPYIY